MCSSDLGLNNPVTMVTGFDRPNLFFRVVIKECMTVNTSSGIFEMEQMESLIYKCKQSTLMGVPVEKVFQRKRASGHTARKPMS